MNSNFARLATASNYPTGMMNTCQCGQVVLAPATIHDICKSDGTCYHSECGRSLPNRKVVK
jgi:hypothetical protein